MKEIEILNNGGIILYPTDTIWGLGCDATNIKAIEKIISLKGRDSSKNLIILVSDIEMLENYVEFLPPQALTLLNKYETPLTIIYPKSKNLPSILSQDQSIGIRIPKHTYCKELIRNLKRPIVSTSANISKEPSPKSFKEIRIEIKNGVDFIAEVQQDKESSQASSIFKITLEGETIQIR